MESMKNEKPPTKPQTNERSVVARMADGEPIAVYELVFRREFPDLAFDASGGSGRWRVKKNRSITYFPKLHIYRLEENYPDKHPRIIFVPREWASFEPLTEHHRVV